ncbi:MAG: response regulator [Spirochaetia bacterium]|nr:response regulator [Spirochaetia bacterium]
MQNHASFFNISILVVEDEQEIRQILAKTVKRWFSTVYEAGTGKEGLDIYFKKKPEIILSDIRMPDMDGLVMAMEIRGSNPGIPIIITTAYNDDEYFIRAIESGVDKFILKPVDFNILFEVLSNAAGRVQLSKDKLRLEREMLHLSQAIRQSNDMIILADRQGRIIYLNSRKCEDILNPSGSLMGKMIQEVMPLASDLIHHCENYESQSRETEIFIQSENPVSLSVSVSNFYSPEGEQSGFLFILHDISARKELEASLKKAKEKAEADSHFKSEFLAAMSHDIRNPMNIIVGITDLLLKENADPAQSEYLHLVQDASESLVILINGILDVAKIESGKLNFETIDFHLPDLLKFIEKLYNVEAKKKGVHLETNIPENLPVSLMGDPYRIQQILINLVSNAVKFTEDGEILIHVCEQTVPVPENSYTGTYLFTIADSGKGIAADRLDTIFDSFSQENFSIARQYGGSGLGTTIVKNLVKLMGGSIGVRSPAEQFPSKTSQPGSEFWFTLPLKVNLGAEHQPQIFEQQAMEESIKKANLEVLIAEDNEVNSLLLSKVLDQMGVKSDIAANGEFALAMAAKKSYSMIFMDVEMPVLNGIMATRRLRKDGNNIPVIACTGHAFKDELDEIMAAGMSNYLIKPVRRNDVMTMLWSLIG